MGLTVPYDGEHQDVEKMSDEALEECKRDLTVQMNAPYNSNMLKNYYAEKVDIINDEQWARRNG